MLSGEVREKACSTPDEPSWRNAGASTPSGSTPRPKCSSRSEPALRRAMDFAMRSRMASDFSAAAVWANSAGGQLSSSGRKSVCASPIALSSPSGSWSIARTIHGSLRSSVPKYCAKPSRSTCPVSSCSAKLSERPCANSLFETFQTRTESKCAGNRSSTSELNFTPKAMTSPQATSSASAKACTRPGRRARKRATEPGQLPAAWAGGGGGSCCVWPGGGACASAIALSG